MKPYALSLMDAEDVEIFERVRKAVIDLPDIDLGVDENGEEIVLSCHILARALSKVFSLDYVDGYFYPNFEHSWLITNNGHIIDPYPVAILGGPILIDGVHYSPAMYIYIKKPTREISRGRFGKSSFRRSVRMVERFFRG